MNTEKEEKKVVIQTDFGDIVAKLYNKTPLHRDNFIKLVKEDFYRDLLFHRVIKDFMIQGGDYASGTSVLREDDLANAPDYTVPAEFVYPEYYHKRGALAAARLGDNVNPEKASSASQFYIVTGAVFSEAELALLEKQRFEKLKQAILGELQAQHKDTIKELYRGGEKEKLTQFRNNLIAQSIAEAGNRKDETAFSPTQKSDYASIGGAPHLDGEYSVFGEIIEGMDVVDKIQNIRVNQHDKPLTDVKMRIEVLKEI
ncbi:peptidylprolyl isomerase [Viscerimonas tarda]